MQNNKKIAQFIMKLQQRSIHNHEISARIIEAPHFKNTYELNTWFYDFDKVKKATEHISSLNPQKVLHALFHQVTWNVKDTDHQEKWLIFADFISSIVLHPPLTQPMYEDKAMVTHPLVLLSLGEGRCGHTARLIVDAALANGYEARLVQLAAHLVAEVKYDGSWHFIDADAHFPLDDLRKLKPLPSVAQLSKTPYLLDQLPARGWRWSNKDQRTTGNNSLSYAMFYPGVLLTSSMYFGEQIFKNLYTGDPNQPRKGIAYHYKQGTPQAWQHDKFYGWNQLNSKLISTPSIPVEFFMPPTTVLAPTILYKNETNLLPIRFLPVERPSVQGNELFNVKHTLVNKYEIRISSTSRGWDYDFRHFKYMPARSLGDILVTRSIEHYPGGLLGTDINLKGITGDVFIEVIPIDRQLAHRGTYIWPSSEIQVQIFPKNYRKWNYSS